VLITYVDSERRYRFNNKAYEEWFGVSREQAHGKLIEEVLGREAYQTIREHVQAALSGKRVSYERLVPLVPYKGAGTRWIEATYVPNFGENGRVEGFFALVQDITRRKRAEEAMRESEARYRTLFDDSPVPVLEVDSSEVKRHVDSLRDSGVSDVSRYFDTHPEAIARCAAMLKVLDVNKATLQLAEAAAKETLREGLPKLLSKEAHHVFRKGIVAFAEGKTSFESQASIQTLDGKKRDIVVRVSIPPGHEATWSRVLVSCVDITELKEAEQLRLSEERLRQLAENIQQVFWMTDPETNEVIYVSAAYEKVWGRTRESLYQNSRSWLDAVHPDDRGQVRGNLLKRLRAGHDEEYRVVRPDGTVRVVRDRSFPIRDEQGRVYRLAGVVEDISDRKRAEDALRESEERHRTLFESTDEGIIVSRPDGSIISANPAAAKMIGCDSPEELMRMSTADFYADAETRRQVINEVREKGYLKGAELKARTRQGTFRTCLVSLVGRFDNNGEIMRIDGLFRDITDRKRTEDALRESEERFRAIFESTTDCILVWDRDYNYIYANQASIDHVATTRDKVIRKNIRDGLGHIPDFMRLWMSRVDRVFETGAPMRVEDAVPVGDRLVYSESVLSPIRDPRGKMIAVGVVYRDVTERKKAEQALAAEKERLAVTLQSIADGVIATDKEGKAILLNAVAQEVTGWRQEAAVGKPLRELFDAVDGKTRQKREDPVQLVLKSDRPVESATDSVLLRRGGDERIVTYSASPIRDGRGETIGVVLAFRDVTEQRKMEEELLNAQKMEAVGLLAGGIAHDFNNVLTAATANLFLARANAEDNPVLLEKIAGAEKAIFQAKRLTQQLLTFSRGGAPVKRAASISELLKETTEFALSGSNVTCEFCIPDDVWDAEIDFGQISQVINNLIINAAQAMPQGGVVRVSAENVRVTRKEALPIKHGRCVRISIRDCGPGIPKEHFGKIFHPYFTTKRKGTGLGLATAYTIVRRHSGYIGFESEPGIGTTFYVYLPASRKRAPRKKRPLEKPIRGQGRILLMDDEEEIRDAAGQVLKSLGYEVDCARDGAEAVERYIAARESGHPYDAVILDLTVPGAVGGEQAIKKLLEIQPNIKAIASSGYSNDPVVADPASYGFAAVLTKPYKGEELSEALHNLLTAGRE
jgi:PAS domain S-box-containing protein